MIDLYLPKRKLAVEVEEFGHKNREQKKKKIKDRKNQKCILGVYF